MLSNVHGDSLGVCLKIGLNFPRQMFTRRKRGDVNDELPKKIGEKRQTELNLSSEVAQISRSSDREARELRK